MFLVAAIYHINKISVPPCHPALDAGSMNGCSLLPLVRPDELMTLYGMDNPVLPFTIIFRVFPMLFWGL